jgi:hypothetical protein
VDASNVKRSHAGAPWILLNGILFNVSWFCIVASESAVLAPLVAALHLIVHFSLVGRGLPEVGLVAVVTVIGVVLDNLLFRAGVFNVGGAYASPPLWITSLWPVLATTLMHAFRTLQSRPVLAILFGAVGGALSYTAGTSLTAVRFFDPVLGPLVLGALWAMLFPLLLAMAAYTERQQGQRPC